MAKLAKPTVEDILKLYDDTERLYAESGLYQQFDTDDKMYELDFANELNLPVEFEKEGIVLPTARDIVDTCVDHTSISNARVQVTAKGPSKKEQEKAEMQRKFGLGVLYRNNVEATIAPLRVSAKHYWVNGLTVIKDVWDADRYLDKPERKEDESENEYGDRIDKWRSESHDSIPIVIQAVHPRNIMLDPYHDGKLYVFETREELAYNVMAKYPNWRNLEGKRITEKVKHITCFIGDYRCELYDKDPVLKAQGGVVKTRYGFIPYVPIDTGLGNITADNNLKKRYVGILRYIKDLLISESRDYSIGDVILKRTAFPWGYLKGAKASEIIEIYQQFGQYQALPEGVEIVDMSPKAPPDALLTWMSVASQYLAAHGAPNSVRGLGETGVRSGADRRLLLAEASSRYTYSNEAFQHGVARVLSNCARIMKNVIPGNLNVWARTPVDEFDLEVEKDMLEEPFTFYVKFNPVSPEEDYRQHDDLERMVKAGILTVQTAREKLPDVDPKKLRREELKEEIRKSPAYLQVRDQFIAAQLAQRLAALQAKDQITSGQVPPLTPPATPQPGVEQPQPPMGGMVPPIPNVAPIGSGQAMQNELRNQRSGVSMTQQGQGGGGAR